MQRQRQSAPMRQLRRFHPERAGNVFLKCYPMFAPRTPNVYPMLGACVFSAVCCSTADAAVVARPDICPLTCPVGGVHGSLGL